ncbi:hypothetical protein GIB67_036083 [Kingdonia uniflora]|uniref:KIB1-4 beta-propeller domain-containing protein n=1 Tax=Kingdonia uniflora TaxID=39325 RepID=A0A7J7N950_9MAGN|nr:hypothetical protein GIB67_036083 [Kingdonia uniflora]
MWFFKHGSRELDLIHVLQNHSYNDILCQNGNFYIVYCNGNVQVFNSANSTYWGIPQPQINTVGLDVKYYLVESLGDVLLVCVRLFEFEVFEVFRLYASEGLMKGKWIEVKSLGDQAIFLGSRYSLSFSFHEFTECKANSIYFHRPKLSMHRIGVYSLETGSIRFIDDSSFFCSDDPGIWVTPYLS